MKITFTTSKVTKFLDQRTYPELLLLARLSGYEHLCMKLYDGTSDMEEISKELGVSDQYVKYFQLYENEKNISRRGELSDEYCNFLEEIICLSFAKRLYAPKLEK